MIEQRIELNGRAVRYLTAGAGPPVVFAAGLGISADFYRPNIETIAGAGFRVFVPDAPGSGKTSGKAFGISVSEITNDLIALAEAFGLARVHWIGHSIGCQAALEVAARRPDLAASLILAGPTGGHGRRLTHQARAIAWHAVHEPWPLLKAVARDYVRLSPLSYIGTWSKAARHDPLDTAERVRCPVTILIGSRDRVPSAEFVAALALKLGDAESIEIAGGQHGLPIDAREQFERTVIRILRQRGG